MARFAWMGMAALAVTAGFLAAKPPSSPYEKVVIDILNTLQRMTKALATIQDKETAAKAQQLLKDEVAQFLKVRGDAGKMPQPNKEEKDQVAFRYRAKLANVMTKFKAEYRRAKGIPGSEIALKEMQSLFRAPKKKNNLKKPNTKK